MLLADLPSFFAKRWAADTTGSYIRSIPTTTVDPDAASLSLGFPPNTFVDESAGGVPPDGRDFNGILNFLTAWGQWQGAGGAVPFNSAVVSATGGYPKGARLMSTANPALTWVSTVDNNTTNPDAPGATNWVVEGLGTSTINLNGGHIQFGPLIFNFGQTVLTDSSGVKIVTFDKPFSASGDILAVSATNNCGGTRPSAWSGVGNLSKTGMLIGMSITPGGGGSGVPAPAGTASWWWALGT